MFRSATLSRTGDCVLVATFGGSASLRLLKLLLTTLLTLTVLPVANGAQNRTTYLKKTTVCDYTYGTTIVQLADVRSFLTCANKCANNDQCVSLTYDVVTKLCKINSEAWFNPNTTGCTGNNVFYAEQVIITTTPIPTTTTTTTPTTTTPPPPCCGAPINNVRLCDGGGTGVCDPTQGRLEVFHDNTWGTVCDDLYSPEQMVIATVACKQLGYTSGTAVLQAPYGPGVEPTWMDDVFCTGSETSVLDCPHAGWGVENCSHNEDLGVVCV